MSDIALGILIPIRRGKTGFFEQSFDIIEQVKSNLINLLLTRKGERPFQPEFGSNLHNLLFTQMDDQYDQQVKASVQSAVSVWMPFLNIEEQVVDRNDDRNSTLVKIKFSLRTNADITESLVIEF